MLPSHHLLSCIETKNERERLSWCPNSGFKQLAPTRCFQFGMSIEKKSHNWSPWGYKRNRGVWDTYMHHWRRRRCISWHISATTGQDELMSNSALENNSMRFLLGLITRATRNIWVEDEMDMTPLQVSSWWSTFLPQTQWFSSIYHL